MTKDERNEHRAMFCILISVLKGDSPWSWAWLALATYYQYRSVKQASE